MKYKILYTKKAVKQLFKIDPNQRNMVLSWLEKNLLDVTTPRMHGDSLKGDLQDYWRYRIGDYRIIAEINDDKLKIIIFKIGFGKRPGSDYGISGSPEGPHQEDSLRRY